MNYELEGKVVIITGAARGVGRAMVRLFVAQGARVLAADREAEGLAETCAAAPGAVALVADVSTPEGAAHIVAAALQQWGRLEVCVNNAAVAPHAALLEESAEVWDRVYAVNCRGTFLMTQAAGRAMIAGQRGGRIINFSSGASQRGGPGLEPRGDRELQPGGGHRAGAAQHPGEHRQSGAHRHPAPAAAARHGSVTAGADSNDAAGARGHARRSGARGDVPGLRCRQLYYGDNHPRRRRDGRRRPVLWPGGR